MNVRELHSWDLTPREARCLQVELQHLVERAALSGNVRLVAGVDVHVPAPRAPARGAGASKLATAAVAVLSYPGLDLVECALGQLPITFPYVPGLLSFREIPPVLEALRRLQVMPDLFLCDGQGYAHPRRFGLACHLGVLTGVPTIGVAKSLLVGAHEPLAESRGSWAPLLDGDEVVGAAVRTRTGVTPVYVSVGHKVDLPSAIGWVLRCAPRFRLPETTRQAHKLAAAAA